MGDLGVFTKTGLNIHWGQDKDWFDFAATSTGSGTISTSGSGDVNLYLYDDAGSLLKASTNTGASESITWNFVEGQEYYVLANTYNSTTSSGYQIAWNIKPTINALASDPVANEFGGNSGIIGISRNGPTTSPLTVNFTVGGTATRGTDYDLYLDGVLVAGNSITIGNLASVGNVEVRPIVDHVAEPAETVTLTLASNAAYVIGGGTSGTVNIGDSGPAVAGVVQTWQTSPHKLAFDIERVLASTIQLGDFAVVDTSTNLPVNPQSINVVQNGNDATATLTFNGVLPDGRYRATLNGAGIANADGDVMFGSFVYDFFVLTGDANHDARINLDDFNILAANFGQSGRDGSTGDFTYDGQVNLDDFNVLAAKFGTILAGPSTDSVAGIPRGTSGSPFAGGTKLGSDDDLGDLSDLLG
jgi:hypothetical protein